MKLCFAIVLFSVFFSLKLLSQKTEFTTLPNYDSDVTTFSIIDEELICYPAGDYLRFWDIKKNEIIDTYQYSLNSKVVALISNSESEYLIAGTKEGSLLVFSKQTKGLVYKKEVDASGITSLSPLIHHSRILIGCANGKVYEIDVSKQDEPKLFFSCDETVTAIHYSEKLDLAFLASGEGVIELFKGPAFNWLKRTKVSKKWIRDLAVDETKSRLFAAGDDGVLWEWKVDQDGGLTFLRSQNIWSNWILSIDAKQGGGAVAMGGLNHKLLVYTNFGSYEVKLKGPIKKAEVITDNGTQLKIVCCVHGVGIQIIPLVDMNYKSSF